MSEGGRGGKNKESTKAPKDFYDKFKQGTLNILNNSLEFSVKFLMEMITVFHVLLFNLYFSLLPGSMLG